MAPPAGTTPRPLAPTAREFASTPTEETMSVLDATFISHTLPDIAMIPKNTGIVGLCAVPHDRAGTDDLGWHIADFLAFKSLLCGDNHPRSQSWLAQCDIGEIVRAHPEGYVHGSDGRVVADAADVFTHPNRAGEQKLREDNIKVEPSAEKLETEFSSAITEKSKVARNLDIPLIIIICGLTTLEQDVFFGKTDAKHRLTSGQIQNLIGDDVSATVITPALFSAGWQVNPSFGRSPTKPVRAGRIDFLARQLGGLFSKDCVHQFVGWECPMLDLTQVDEYAKEKEAYPEPAKPTDEERALLEALQIQVHSCLAGRLSLHHKDHSFRFDAEGDEWEKLIGPRQHTQLAAYENKWKRLPQITITEPKVDNFTFLGNAFGGSKSSQLSHIKHLVMESFEAWPGHWRFLFGRDTKAKLEQFLAKEAPDSLECHEIFNIMEHRATTAVLADMVVAYFNLPKPYNDRCRDWDQLKWQEDMKSQSSAASKAFWDLSKSVSGVTIPPGVSENHLSQIQTRLETQAFYICAALHIRYVTNVEGVQAAVKRIQDLLHEVKVQQVNLILENPELRRKCTAWLEAINMPIRQLTAAEVTAGVEKFPVPPNWPRLDDEDVIISIESKVTVDVSVDRDSGPLIFSPQQAQDEQTAINGLVTRDGLEEFTFPSTNAIQQPSKEVVAPAQAPAKPNNPQIPNTTSIAIASVEKETIEDEIRRARLNEAEALRSMMDADENYPDMVVACWKEHQQAANLLKKLEARAKDLEAHTGARDAGTSGDMTTALPSANAPIGGLQTLTYVQSVGQSALDEVPATQTVPKQHPDQAETGGWVAPHLRRNKIQVKEPEMQPVPMDTTIVQTEHVHIGAIENGTIPASATPTRDSAPVPAQERPASIRRGPGPPHTWGLRQ